MGQENDRREGVSPRLVTAAVMALVGVMFLFFVLEEDVRNKSVAAWPDLPAGLILRYLVAMALGGAISGWLLAGLFGRNGILGWMLAAIGGVLATHAAGLIGSALGRAPDLLADGWQMADLVSITTGLLIPVFAMADHALIAVAWLALIVVAHLLAGRARG